MFTVFTLPIRTRLCIAQYHRPATYNYSIFSIGWSMFNRIPYLSRTHNVARPSYKFVYNHPRSWSCKPTWLTVGHHIYHISHSIPLYPQFCWFTDQAKITSPPFDQLRTQALPILPLFSSRGATRSWRARHRHVPWGAASGRTGRQGEGAGRAMEVNGKHVTKRWNLCCWGKSQNVHLSWIERGMESTN
jgi:hypothetical protein